MSTHLPEPPTRPSADTPRLLAEDLLRSSSESPPPLTVCWHCGEAAGSRSPLGWVVAGLAPGSPVASGPHAFGICPGCLDAWAAATNPYTGGGDTARQ